MDNSKSKTTTRQASGYGIQYAKDEFMQNVQLVNKSVLFNITLKNAKLYNDLTNMTPDKKLLEVWWNIYYLISDLNLNTDLKTETITDLDPGLRPDMRLLRDLRSNRFLWDLIWSDLIRHQLRELVILSESEINTPLWWSCLLFGGCLIFLLLLFSSSFFGPFFSRMSNLCEKQMLQWADVSSV